MDWGGRTVVSSQLQVEACVDLFTDRESAEEGMSWQLTLFKVAHVEIIVSDSNRAFNYGLGMWKSSEASFISFLGLFIREGISFSSQLIFLKTLVL